MIPPMTASHSLLLTTQIAYGPHPRQRIDVVAPQDADGQPALLLLPGGWWRNGRREDLRLLALHLAECGIPAAALGLRQLGDEGVHDGRDLVTDLVAAARLAVEEASLLGASARECRLAGTGAGAVLAVLGCRALAASAETPRVIGVVTCALMERLAPWPGCPAVIADALRAFAGNAAADLDHGAIDPKSLPAHLLLHGDADGEVPAAQAGAVQRRLLAVDCPAELALIAGAGHPLLADPASAYGRNAVDRLRDWIRKQDQA